MTATSTSWSAEDHPLETKRSPPDHRRAASCILITGETPPAQLTYGLVATVRGGVCDVAVELQRAPADCRVWPGTRRRVGQGHGREAVPRERCHRTPRAPRRRPRRACRRFRLRHVSVGLVVQSPPLVHRSADKLAALLDFSGADAAGGKRGSAAASAPPAATTSAPRRIGARSAGSRSARRSRYRRKPRPVRAGPRRGARWRL